MYTFVIITVNRQAVTMKGIFIVTVTVSVIVTVIVHGYSRIYVYVIDNNHSQQSLKHHDMYTLRVIVTVTVSNYRYI